jgi:3-dehydroquinate synthase
MGMLDASIDFKQAVNHRLGKNLLGCYYPANAIIMDPETLSTLSERHIRNGIAEALKHGLAQSEALAQLIAEPLRRGEQALRDAAYLEAVCKASIEIKCPTLDYYHDSDYNEMVPQYGHAIGHAVEHISWSSDKHKPMFHGEAICIGMCVSAEIALLLGLCDENCVNDHYEIIGACGLPAYVPKTMTVADIRRKIMFDKHFVKTPAMGLPSSIGCLARSGPTSYAWSIEDEILDAALRTNMMRGDDIGITNLTFLRPAKATTKEVNVVGAYSKAKGGNDCPC